MFSVGRRSGSMSSIGCRFGFVCSAELLPDSADDSPVCRSPRAQCAERDRPQAAANSATANDNPPWNNAATPIRNAQTAKVLSTTNFLNTTNVPLTPGATSDTKLEQDNQKLFSLYNAVNTLAYLAKMAQSSTETSGQLAGLNTRFQTGPGPGPAISRFDQFQQLHLAGGNAVASSVTSTAEHRASAASPTTPSSWSPTPISTIPCPGFRRPAVSPSR